MNTNLLRLNRALNDSRLLYFKMLYFLNFGNKTRQEQGAEPKPPQLKCLALSES